jgi:hypothetical protein
MAQGRFEIDHVFVFTALDAVEEIATLAQAGRVESNRRRHTGQGTSNVCYCFDNAYLELLWAVDADELAAPSVARTGLAERSRWRETGASPFGIALRPAEPGDLPFETWDYEAPFLPAGLSLPVATASDDAAQPMVFQSPGTSRPDQWTNGRDGDRQNSADLAEIVGVHLTFPVDITPHGAFVGLASDGHLSLDQGPTGPSLTLTISRGKGCQPRNLTLPGCTVTD